MLRAACRTVPECAQRHVGSRRREARSCPARLPLPLQSTSTLRETGPQLGHFPSFQIRWSHPQSVSSQTDIFDSCHSGREGFRCWPLLELGDQDRFGHPTHGSYMRAWRACDTGCENASASPSLSLRRGDREALPDPHARASIRERLLSFRTRRDISTFSTAQL
jgi:hypothetical protein